METVGHLIGGKTVASSGRVLPLNNPAPGYQEGIVTLASASKTLDAIVMPDARGQPDPVRRACERTSTRCASTRLRLQDSAVCRLYLAFC